MRSPAIGQNNHSVGGGGFPGETARVGSETRQPMFGFELVIAAAIWTPLTVAACKWIADA